MRHIAVVVLVATIAAATRSSATSSAGGRSSTRSTSSTSSSGDDDSSTADPVAGPPHRSSLAPTARLAVDLGTTPAPFPHFWKRSWGSGHALMGTRADWQGQLRLAVAELGLQGLRMHGVLDDDMSVVNDKGMYSWYNIDRVYDFMLSLNVRPVVELSFMPKYLANCSDCPSKDGNPRQCFYAFGDPGSYKGLTQPPQDFADWYDLIHALATHLTERHGLAEVSQWHFEVWNEMWMMSYPGSYLPLFNASARALKDVSPTLKVGGPSSEQTQNVHDLIRDTKRLGIPLDFISTHFYNSDPNCTRNDTKYGSDPDCFSKVVNEAKSWAADAGLPFLLTEYNAAYFGHDTSYAAAFLIRNIPLLTGLDVLSYWTFSDIFEESWLAGPPFQDTWGCMTKEGIRKPAWRAFQLLHQAGDQKLNVSVTPSPASAQTAVTAFATTVSGGGGRPLHGLQIFTSNFWPSSGASANPRTPVTTELLVQLRVPPAPPPGIETEETDESKDNEYEEQSEGLGLGLLPISCFLWRIDDNSTAPAAAWRAMGSPGYLSPTQLEALAEASQMVSEELTVGKDGTISFSLPPYGVGVLRFDGAKSPYQ